MRNWSVDTTKLKQNPKEYEKWKVEQMLTYGMDKGDMLNKEYLRENLSKLNIPSDMANYIKFLLED